MDLRPGFVAEVVASGLDAATAIVPTADGRVLIAEQTGRVLVWKDGRVLDDPLLSVPVTDYWERGLVGLAVHPEFPAVPQVFVLYVKEAPFVHHVLSRFEVDGDRAVAGSEEILLEGDDQERFGGFQRAGHQGGILRFGRDGMLYAGIGEQTAGELSQDFWALQGKILRVAPDGSIPKDNPFYRKASGKYRSIFATGVRNPFGLAWQGTGAGARAFFTDVGGSAFEEINELVAGANYGWPEAEGTAGKEGFTRPLFAYPPSVGRSVCGGTFYPAGNPGGFPEEWRGMFFFSDFVDGWVKAIHPDRPGQPVSFATGFDRPVAVEAAPDGSLLVLARGAIWRDPAKFVPESGNLVRIVYTGAVQEPVAPPPAAPPAALGVPGSYAGLPDDFAELPVAGLFSGGEVPEGARARKYVLNCEPWEPGVEVDRWFVLPEVGAFGFATTGGWEVPDGTVLGRTFTVAADDGSTRRRIETRVIVLRRGGGFGATYRWDGDQARRQDQPVAFEIAPGRQWMLPPAEPVLGANPFADAFLPGLNTRQLNRVRDGGENQLLEWAEAGLLSGLPAGGLDALPALADVADEESPLELRVRSYLDANCAFCHQPGGASRGLFDARFDTPLAGAGIVGGALAAGDLGVPGAAVVVPGQPGKSVLLKRLAERGLFRMPPVQFHGEVSPAAPVVEAWIRGLE